MGLGYYSDTSSTSPYNYVYNNILAGTYTFYAIATDANGATTTSSAVTVTVPASSTPVVVLTNPINGSSYTAGSNVTFTATASETNGSIAKVSFYYNGTNLIGTTTTPPYTYTATNVTVGGYTFTAVATDVRGVSVTSSPITVTVTNTSTPVVAITSPVSGSRVTAGSTITIAASALETNGTISKVAFL